MYFLKFAILISQYVVVYCVVPDLNVNTVNKTLIAQKRQDTLDMCRIFNEAGPRNLLVRHQPPHSIVNSLDHRRSKRMKRSALKYAVNPALKPEDEKRVEDIVDKLYDDLDEKKIKTKGKKLQSMKPSRRFDFAPNVLMGPSPPEADPKPIEDLDIPSKARWKYGVVPYFIDPKTYDSQLIDTIRKAFDYIEKATCIRMQKLREKPIDVKSLRDVDWVYISNPFGIRQCVHSNENRKLDGVQMSVIGYDCMSIGDIVHEVMHILGFSHEHTRADRDQYVSVLWDNIKPGYKKYFEINGQKTLYNLETLPYDYASIMHYPPRAFSKNGQVTLLAENGANIGQREGLSEIDVEKVGLIYSGQCVFRNKQYLLKTCPSVVKADISPVNVSQQEVNDYFKDRLWQFGIINYKFRDAMEFTPDERENMLAVFHHIEKETCIRFNDIGVPEDGNEDQSEEDEHTKFNDDNLDVHEIVDNTNNNKIDETSDENNDIEPNFVVVNDTKENNDERKRVKRDTDIMKEFHKIKKEGKRLMKRGKKSIKHLTDLRRHASNVIVLARSALPGCKCPEPGKPSGNKVLEVHADCFNSVNDLLHFFVHVLGLDHQHNMHDRDSYLYIMWEKMIPEIKEEISVKLPPAASAGFSYDYQSVMHYPWLEIKNGVRNIMLPIWKLLYFSNNEITSGSSFLLQILPETLNFLDFSLYNSSIWPCYSHSFESAFFPVHVVIDNSLKLKEEVYFLLDQWLGYQQIYTDGSKSSTSVSSALWSLRAGQGHGVCLPEPASSFTAECYAVFMALEYIEK